ncbi:hypothetical protein ABC357_09340 [Bacillus sp. 1P06AnD]
MHHHNGSSLLEGWHTNGSINEKMTQLPTRRMNDQVNGNRNVTKMKLMNNGSDRIRLALLRDWAVM